MKKSLERALAEVEEIRNGRKPKRSALAMLKLSKLKAKLSKEESE